ncbi:TetR/AcrR family transcriptional regulator [Streptomyces sp. NPDC127068]|uniref:TetR/AcrR family transcriptional regulator n=1 Tax=Streptomyces sp. NPDC127068 TaxID=3347127 RepID=UPI003660666E
MSSSTPRPRRADAERSRAAILDAAVTLFATEPDAGLRKIAEMAGVTRQTVYAHYPSREALLDAVTERVTGRAVAAMDAAGLEEGPAVDALLRLQDIGWEFFEGNPTVGRATDRPTRPARPDADEALHEPVDARLRQLIERGQAAGEFDPAPPAHWLAAVVKALGHAAGGEVTAGRMTVDEAAAAHRTATLRALGVTHDPAPRTAGTPRTPEGPGDRTPRTP